MSARKAKAAKPAAGADAPKSVVSYKGFDKDFACRGHKFEVGQSYSVTGKVAVCANGFHACSNPFDVWAYYGPADGNRFAVVEQSGDLATHDEDSKVASATITITAELSLPEFVKRAVSWVIDYTRVKPGVASVENDNGGDYAKIGSSGYNAKIGSSGGYAKIGSSGNNAQIGSSGGSAKIGSSGNNAQIGSSSYNAQIGSSGDYAKIGSSGNNAQIGSSGGYAKIGSSGNNAQIGSSGDSAKIGSSGDSAKIGSSGEWAWIEASGDSAVIAGAGAGMRVKASAGAWIAIPEFRNGKCVGFATGCAGVDGVQAGVWLVARGGKLVPEAA